MKLRQKSKRDQALDATASIAKTWSEWRLGEKVANTATKASKGADKVSRKAKKATSGRSSRRTRLKIAGAVALVGGIGAALAKKLGGAKAEPLYTPPGPAPDMAPPPSSQVAAGDLKDGPAVNESIASTTVPSTLEPALTASTEVPERDPSPVVVEDLAGEATSEPEAQSTASAPGDAPSVELEDLSGSADPAPADDADDDKPA
jgi:hypothetical protein